MSDEKITIMPITRSGVNILYGAIFLIISISTSSYGKECRQSCTKDWCPAVRNGEWNKWIDETAADPEEPPGAKEESCVNEWCPAVRCAGWNAWLNPCAKDPEEVLKEADSETQEPTKKPEQPPTTQRADGSQGKESGNSKENVNVNEKKEETQEELPYLPRWNKYWSLDCKTRAGEVIRNGARCLAYPTRTKIGQGTPCYLGTCVNGICRNILPAKCATS
ncbi:uncharacterized protein LOC144118861 isoform X2 [Amblyomma americanum]